MRLTQTRWRALVDTVHLGTRRYRVLRPADPISHAWLHQTNWYSMDMDVDHDAAVNLAMAWRLAARSPHTLIYLPLRSPRPSGDGGQQPLLDLVLLHHRLAFPAADWKQVRRRLSAGTPLQVRLPADAFDDRPLDEHRRWTHRGFQDHLRWDLATDTLFLIGSRYAFNLEANQLRGLAEDAAAYAARHQDGHYCAEINVGRLPTGGRRDRRHPCSELHVLYRPRQVCR